MCFFFEASFFPLKFILIFFFYIILVIVKRLHLRTSVAFETWFFFRACEEARDIFLLVVPNPTVHPLSYVPSPGVTSSAWTKINDGVTRLGLSRPFSDWQLPHHRDHQIVENSARECSFAGV